MLSDKQIEAALGALPHFRWWARGIECLDEAFQCGDNTRPNVVASRLAALDVFYGVGLSKRSNWERNGSVVLETYQPRIWPVAQRIAEWEQRPDQVWGPNRLEDLCLQKLSESNARDGLARLVEDLARIPVERRHGRELVAVTKYLHFRFPRLVPISDEVVTDYLKKQLNAASDRTITYGKLVELYYEFLSGERGRRLVECRIEHAARKTPVRLLDAILWLVGTARRSRDNKKNINREVQLYFVANPEARDALLGP